MRLRITPKLLVPLISATIFAFSFGVVRGAAPIGHQVQRTIIGQHYSARVIPDMPSPTWVNLIPLGAPPSARSFSSATYDPISDNMTIFGGIQPDLNDTWVLSNADGHSTATWSQLNPVGGPPSPRFGMTTVYNPGTNSMVMFGGNPDGGFCGRDVNDTWVLTGANGFGTPAWTQLNPAGKPPSPRDATSAVYDVTTNRMIVFGGRNACAPYLNDVHVLSNADGLGGMPTWTKLGVNGTLPSGRSLHTAVYDPNTNRMIVFGGYGGSPLSDVWVLTDANGLAVGATRRWIQLTPIGGPGTRYGHTAVYDPATNKMIVFGGIGPGGSTNDTWVLSHANGIGGAPTWCLLTPSGGPPAARVGHTAVFYNPARHRMTVFSGQDDVGGHYNDVWVLTRVP